jgi:hypothetical protein
MAASALTSPFFCEAPSNASSENGFTIEAQEVTSHFCTTELKKKSGFSVSLDVAMCKLVLPNRP